MEFDFDSHDGGGDAWLLDAAMATSLHFSAASPPPWPCGGDPHHPSVPLDATAALHDDYATPGARAGEVSPRH
jgi:hypothetical protein